MHLYRVQYQAGTVIDVLAEEYVVANSITAIETIIDGQILGIVMVASDESGTAKDMPWLSVIQDDQDPDDGDWEEHIHKGLEELRDELQTVQAADSAGQVREPLPGPSVHSVREDREADR